MWRGIRSLLLILALLPTGVGAQSISKTDILKQMKQFGFSDEVTAAAVEAGISMKQMKTLRDLQAGQFSDAVYLEVIERNGVYTGTQIAELIELQENGFSDAMIIAALPESGSNASDGSDSRSYSPETGTSVSSTAGSSANSESDSPSRQRAQFGSESPAQFPESGHHVTAQTLVGFNSDAYSEELESAGGGFVYTYSRQSRDTRGFFARVDMITVNRAEDIESADDDGIYYTRLHLYGGNDFYLYNGKTAGILGEVVEPGLALSVGPVYGISTAITEVTTPDTYVEVVTSGFILGGRVWAEYPLMPERLYVSGTYDLFMKWYSGTTTSTSSFTGFDTETEVEESAFTPTADLGLVFYPTPTIPNLSVSLGLEVTAANADESFAMVSIGATWARGPRYPSGALGTSRY